MPGRTRFPSLLLICSVLLVPAGLLWSQQERGLRVVGNDARISMIPGNAGKRYAICIGVDGYLSIPRLEKARNDAEGFADALQKLGQFDSVFLMTDTVHPASELREYPSLSNIRHQLEFYGGFIESQDLVVIFFAGHGFTGGDERAFLALPETSVDDLEGTAIAVREIADWLKDLGVRKSLLLLDACRNVPDKGSSRGVSVRDLKAERFQSAEVSAVFYATQTGYFSFEDPQSEHGIFTRFLLEGVKGKADYQHGNRDGIVTFRELSSFVEDSVSSYAMQHHKMQKPHTQFNSEVFGDLAISTYSASIDAVSYTERPASGASAAPSGKGDIRLYSNVTAEVELDGEPQGRIAGGTTRVFENVRAGGHFLALLHDYGVFRKEAYVEPGSVTPVINITVNTERDPRAIHGITFVFVKGSGAVGDFWISQSETTMGQFAEFVEESGYRAQGRWNEQYKPAYSYYPVHLVTRKDCEEFAKWFSRTGTRVDLPSLEQWAYAAGLNHGQDYPWGTGWNSTFCQNKATEAEGMLPIMDGRGPVQVQFFLRDITLEGVMHMAGNVREWCSDDKEGSIGTLGAIAGGSWTLGASKYFRASYATYKPTHQEGENVGFRLVIVD